MTAGKEGLLNILDAANGRYLKTVDMGLQDFVTRIDSRNRPTLGQQLGDICVRPPRSINFCRPEWGGKSLGDLIIASHSRGHRLTTL